MKRQAIITSALLAAVILGVPLEASADWLAQLQLDSTFSLDEQADSTTAYGGAGAGCLLSYQVPYRYISLGPEFGIGHSWVNEPFDRHYTRFFAGGRLTVPLAVELSLYLHLGAALTKGLADDIVEGGAGMLLDAGLAADYPITSRIAVGLQAGGNLVLSDVPGYWFNIGAHTTFRF